MEVTNTIAVADLREQPLRPKVFLNFRQFFLEILAKSYVGAPWRIGASGPVPALCPGSNLIGEALLKIKYTLFDEVFSRGSRGGPRGPGPPLTLGFEAPKLSILLPYLIFP